MPDEVEVEGQGDEEFPSIIAFEFEFSTNATAG